jgi:hypothetical protein
MTKNKINSINVRNISVRLKFCIFKLQLKKLLALIDDDDNDDHVNFHMLCLFLTFNAMGGLIPYDSCTGWKSFFLLGSYTWDVIQWMIYGQPIPVQW